MVTVPCANRARICEADVDPTSASSVTVLDTNDEPTTYCSQACATEDQDAAVDALMGNPHPIKPYRRVA